RRAGHHAVRVLDVRVLGALRRHVGGAHATGAVVPAGALVLAVPDAATGHRQGQVPAVARVDADGVDARLVVTAAEPVGPLRALPEAVHQFPGTAPVARLEQATGNGAGPEHAELVGASRLQAPDHLHRRPLFTLRCRRK